MHSHPHLVVSAYWTGDVAASMCCAKVIATTRLRTSPTTTPLTPPPGFWRATILPSLMASNISRGMLALTKSRTISNKRSLSLVVQQNSQMFRGHPRWSPGCSSSSCTQTDKEPIAVQGGVNLWSVSHHFRRDGNPGLTWLPSLILQSSPSGVVPCR